MLPSHGRSGPTPSPERASTSGLPKGPTIPIINADSNDGFDRTSSPPWLMVPWTYKNQRWLQLMLRGPEPVTLHHEVYCPFVAAIRGNRLIVDARRPGKSLIELRQGASRLDVEVDVKRVLEVPTVFHFVEHNRFRGTGMTRSRIGEVVDEANKFLQPQANVKVTIDSMRDLTHQQIGRNLGRVVRSSDEEDEPGVEWDAVTRHAVKLGREHEFNVFLVQHYDHARRPGADSAGGFVLAGTMKGNCIFEDEPDKVLAGHTLAHEVLHHLGIRGHTDDPSHLNSLPGGRRIPRAHADRINPTPFCLAMGPR